MAARNTKKVLGTVLALGAATGAIVFGSFAAWTAQSSNNGNSVTTGTLDLTSSDTTAFFSVTNAKPGDTGNKTITLRNTGATPIASVKMTQSNVVNTVGTDIKFKVYDSTADYCIWPDKDAGACAAFGAWTDADLTDASGVPLTGTWTSSLADIHSIRVDWEFDTNSGNGTKSKAASFDLTWDGVQ